MKRIEPLYLLLLFAVLAVFGAYEANVQKEELQEEYARYMSLNELAGKLVSAKRAYGVHRKQDLLHLLHLPRIQRFATIKEERSAVRLRVKSMPAGDASWLLSKLLNDTYPVHTLDLQRSKEGRIDLEMEIRW